MSDMIGRLRVALQLETAAFEKGAKRASAEIDTFGSKAEKAGFKIGSMGKAVIAGGLAVAGSALAQSLKNVVEEGLNYAKTVGQMAKVSNASVEEFQRAAYAAKTVGIETEKLADIYKDMNDRVGDFLETGGGPMKDFFENIAPKVGITADAFKDLSGPQALQLYVSSLEKAGVNQQQMTFYMEAIASDATALIPILRDGGEGFKRLGEEARNAGIILTTDQISKAGETAQKIDALKTALNIRVAGVVIENAQAIGQLAEGLANLLDKMMRLIKIGAQFANSPAGRLLGNLNNAASAINPLTGGLQLLDKVDATINPRKTTGGAAPVAAPSSAPWSKTTGAPMLGRSGGSTYKGPVANLAGGGIMPSAAGTFASQAPGQGDSLITRIFQQSDGLAKVQGVLVDESVKAASKVEIANVQIARSFGEMAEDSLSAMQRLTSAVRGGGVVDILGGILGLGLQLGGAGLFGKSVAARINAPAMPAYANGTRFHPGGLAMVGERGPEVVRLPRGSSVYPNGTGPGGGMQVQVVPSPYFDVRVLQNVGAVAPMIANAGADLGNNRMAKQGRRRLA